VEGGARGAVFRHEWLISRACVAIFRRVVTRRGLHGFGALQTSRQSS